MFGKRKALEAENERLRAALERTGALDAVGVAAELERLQSQVVAAHAELAAAQAELSRVREGIVATEEIALLQEVGVYEFAHPLDDVVAYKSRLDSIKDEIKVATRSGTAVLAATSWTVNGSEAQGRKMIGDFSKLMLRAYNAEADSSVRGVKPHTLASAVERLTKARDTIARLGKTMNIRIADSYHSLRVKELRLTADYLVKVEQEKERVRAERERQREEEAARRDFERERARLAKEQAHYVAALAKVERSGDQAAIDVLRAQVADLNAAMESVEAREANIRAGYVYVISNIGAFGDGMVKVGMTRRLEPMDRIRELGDASVPFRFDVHALVFSDDAVGLESRLHAELADRRVNRVNLNREFFYATVAEVHDVVARIAGQHLVEYRDVADALEWRQSQSVAPVRAAAAAV